ncbi:HNH endonuclease [Marinomonas algarum]|uniref:HNH endonuclease n=1 Tax=Marinomonas algarum TaxID=2883105 RepID=A0A9X1INW4_9GAMM|nr:HNH endonuclease [Marinomonas algarum]MCB5162879.1 HNH endonuclease [Marinomonas algarum]
MKIIDKPTKKVLVYFDGINLLNGEYVTSDGEIISQEFDEQKDKFIFHTPFGYFEYAKFIYYKELKVWPSELFYLDGDSENTDISNLAQNLYTFTSFDDLKNRLCEIFIYDAGGFYSKLSDEKIDFIFVGEKKIPIENLFFYVLNEDLDTIVFPKLLDFSFISDSDLVYGNIIENDFLERISFDFDDLFKYIHYDSEESVLRWKYCSKFSGLKNNILEGMPINIDFIGYRVVYFNGCYYFYEELEERYFRHNDIAPTGDNLSDLSSNFRPVRIKKCFYCGDDSSMTRDHVIPISSLRFKRDYKQSEVVDCCLECNLLLGDKYITTVEERAAFLAERISKRYRSVLSTGNFDNSELDSYGDRVRSYIKANMFKKAVVLNRIDHCHKISGELYDKAEVAHLTGITTLSKKRAYLLIESYLGKYISESDLSFYKVASQEYSLNESEVKDIINEKKLFDVSIQYKFDRSFDCSHSLKVLKKLLARK